jgi:hypothetical protein
MILIALALLARSICTLALPQNYNGGHSFVHPGTLIEIDALPKLSQLNLEDPYIAAAHSYLMNASTHSLNQPARSHYQVKVVFNPAEHDDVPKRFREAFEENNRGRQKGLFAGHEEFTGDAERAYRHAVAYRITRKSEHAEKSIELLRSWSETCKEFGPRSQNGPLEAGWGLASFARAAELLKYTYPNWYESGIEERFKNFVDSVLMPNLRFFDKNGKITNFAAKGNWGSTILEARLQYAIFKEDQEEFRFCLDNFGRLFDNLFPTESGKSIETERDIVHAQFGMGGISGLSELFKNQRIDTYSIRENHLHRVYEYHSSIILGDTPHDVDPKKIRWNKFIPANFEAVYYQFAVKNSMNMPKTLELLKRHRPEVYDMHWGMGTISVYACQEASPMDLTSSSSLSFTYTGVLDPSKIYGSVVIVDDQNHQEAWEDWEDNLALVPDILVSGTPYVTYGSSTVSFEVNPNIF